MDIYDSPKSEVKDAKCHVFSPFKGVLVGLIITILGTSLASVVNTIVCGVIYINELKAYKGYDALILHPEFLISDLVSNLIVLFMAGRFLAGCTQDKRVFYSIVLSALTLLIFSAILLVGGGLSKNPFWYTISILVFTPISIVSGARLRKIT